MVQLAFRKMRLIKYLAASGIASRRKCESIIRTNQVTVNGHPTTNPFLIIQSRDTVCVNGNVVVPAEETVVIILNKPKNTITTVRDTHGRATVMDLIRQLDERVFPIGRLDKDTTGVLLLTNSGDLSHKLTHPKFRVRKIYKATIDKPLSKSDIKKIEAGIEIGDGETGRADVLSYSAISIGNRDKDVEEVRLSLTHGKKREVKRIFLALGRKVQALHRESFVGVTTGKLKPGEWRKMTKNEINSLISLISNHD